MAKIKELLANREKLAKYDELTEWKKIIKGVEALAGGGAVRVISDHVRDILVAALDAEIKKLEKE